MGNRELTDFHQKNEDKYDGQEWDENNKKYNFKKLLKKIHHQLITENPPANKKPKPINTESTMSFVPSNKSIQSVKSVRSLHVDKQ
jgi:hypothetical protein